MPGFVSSISNNNEAVFANNADFSGNTEPNELNGLRTDGQLWIGTTSVNAGGTHINVGTIVGVAGVTIGYSSPNITIGLSGGGISIDSIAMQTGTSPIVPDGSGLVTFNGSRVSAGTNPVRTNGTSANTMQLEVQISQAIAATDATKVGLSNFSSAMFSVDANGFVTLAGGGQAIDSIGTQTGTNPIVPTAAGLVTINGAVVSAGTNPIRSDGTGANTMAIEVQISQAIASTDVTKIGLSNFDSAAFDVDANGFVQLNGGGIAATAFTVDANTAPGTNPVVPTAAGAVTIEAAAVSAHSVPIETRSRAANTFKVEVQEAAAVASTDVTKSGIAHFDSSRFSVDASGFVSTSGTGIGNTLTGNTGGARPPSAGNWNIVTADSTIVFAGSGSTLTLDFTGTNFSLGSTMPSISSGSLNLGIGPSVLGAMSSGTRNVGIGNSAMQAINTGTDNVAVGYNAGNALTSSQQNTLIGGGAGAALTTGVSNTAIGRSALAVFTTGAANAGSNVALGVAALSGLLTGTNNISLGSSSSSAYVGAESSNIIIGATGTAAESNVIRIGTQGTGAGQQSTCFVAGITGVSVSNLNMVTINTSTGQLGSQVVPSSGFTSVVIQTFVASGTYTPTANMKYCIIEVIGCGGGGGGAATTAAGQCAGGSGGGAGEYARGVFTATDIGVSKGVTIGTAGGGNSGAAGSDGGNCSVGSTLISANGGKGGAQSGAFATISQIGSLGGTGGTGGSFRTPGFPGFGRTANTSGIQSDSLGGSSQYGSGGLGKCGGSGDGSAALGYGAGGGGALNLASQAAARTGGSGTAGIVIVTEYI